MALHQSNDISELQRLSRRVSELVFKQQNVSSDSGHQELEMIKETSIPQNVMTESADGGLEIIFEKYEIGDSNLVAHNGFDITTRQVPLMIAELRAQIGALHEELGASEACKDRHSQRCASLEASLAQMTLEMTGMQQQLADAVAAGSHVSAQRDALEGERCTLLASHDELTKRLSTSTAALTASEAAARIVELERDSIAARLGDAQQRLDDMNLQMTGAAAQSEAVIAELRAQIGALHEELGASEACKDRHSQRCASLETCFISLLFEHFATQQALSLSISDQVSISAQRDALAVRIEDLIAFHLSQSSIAFKESQDSARIFREYCDVIDSTLNQAQQKLIDMNMQMIGAAMQADTLIEELRAQIDSLQQELGANKIIVRNLGS